MDANQKIRPLGGCWLDFFHWPEEGRYFSDGLRRMSGEDWRRVVFEMADLGMTFAVLTASAVVRPGREEAYFRTDLLPFPEDYLCPDPIGEVLSAADERNMRVFVSCGWFGNMQRPWENMASAEVAGKAFRAMEQLRFQYGSHPSFYGWYLPDETGINGVFDPIFVDYVNRYAAAARALFPEGKVLIAPYGTRTVKADGGLLPQLEALDCDFIAYQDEVGVRKTSPEESAESFRILRDLHDRAGRSALWADVELFDFEGPVYRSPLIPADPARLEAQLEAVSPFADEILGYEYVGIMTRGKSGAEDYREAYRRMIRPEGR